MLPNANPLHQPLDNGLILKSVSTQQEIDRLGTFNATIHGEPVLDAMTHALIEHHPLTHPDHWLIVTDPAEDDLIVSSLCQIPWRWQYGSVELKAHEMGIVGTLPDYRRRGLIRTLDRQFKTLLAQTGAHVSQIQGIPYYYRQFGYEYALPLEGGWELEHRQVPDDLPDTAHGYNFRAATVDDIPLLQASYDAAARDLDVYAIRDSATWRYLIEQHASLSDGGEFWIASAPDGTPLGYVRIAIEGFGSGLITHEASPMPYPALRATLGWLKQAAIAREKPYIRLAMADSSPLIAVARTLGAHDTGRYAWQLHIPDPAHLLRAIAPELERRLADSMFAELTHSLTLNLYRSAVRIVFDAGRITDVATVPDAGDNAENQLPPNLLAPLVFGWRSREELEATYPDAGAWGMTAALLDVLFPKLDAFFHEIY